MQSFCDAFCRANGPNTESAMSYMLGSLSMSCIFGYLCARAFLRSCVYMGTCLLTRYLSARQYINTRLFRSMSLSAYAYIHTIYSRAFGPFCFGHTKLSIWLLRSGAEYIYIQVQCLRYLDAFNDNHVASIWAIQAFSEFSLDDALFIIWQVRLLTDDLLITSHFESQLLTTPPLWSCVNINSMQV